MTDNGQKGVSLRWLGARNSFDESDVLQGRIEEFCFSFYLIYNNFIALFYFIE